MKTSYQLNSTIYFTSIILRGMGDLGRGLLFVFYSSIGLSIEQFGILAAVAAITVVIFEMPSGVLADKIGRKNTLLISGLFACFTAFFLFIAQSFWTVLIAAITFGIEQAMRSGTGEALMYDTHKILGKEKEFHFFMSKILAFDLYLVAIFSTLAGFLAQINFKFVYAISLFFMSLRLISFLFLKEASLEKSTQLAHHHFFSSVKEVFSDKKIVNILMYSLVLMGTVQAFYKYHQVYLEQVGHSISFIGAFFGLMFVIGGILSHKSHWVVKKINSNKLFYLAPILLGLTYFILGAFPNFFLVWFILVESFIVGVFAPFTRYLVNKHISSAKRATILSIRGFFTFVLAALLGLLIGFGGGSLGLMTMYMILGLTILILGSYFAHQVKHETAE